MLIAIEMFRYQINYFPFFIVRLLRHIPMLCFANTSWLLFQWIDVVSVSSEYVSSFLSLFSSLVEAFEAKQKNTPGTLYTKGILSRNHWKVVCLGTYRVANCTNTFLPVYSLYTVHYNPSMTKTYQLNLRSDIVRYAFMKRQQVRSMLRDMWLT